MHVCARVSVCELMCAQVHVYVYTWKPEVDATVFLNHSLPCTEERSLT